MVLPLVFVFGAGSVAALLLADAEARAPYWVWIAAFLDTAMVFYEMSIGLRPGFAWVRLDLLLTLPLFSVLNGGLSRRAWQAGRWEVGAVLLVAAVGGPVAMYLSV